jgi:hypothetical protein
MCIDLLQTGCLFFAADYMFWRLVCLFSHYNQPNITEPDCLYSCNYFEPYVPLNVIRADYGNLLRENINIIKKITDTPSNASKEAGHTFMSLHQIQDNVKK